MIKKMSGFIDPYSLGLVISLLGVLIIELTHEDAPQGAPSGPQYENVSIHGESFPDTLLNPGSYQPESRGRL